MVAFVVLHYLAESMTIKCVEQLIDIMGDYNYHIVIVDNASPNGSGMNLKTKYSGEKSVTVILNEENLGFAKGNNIGYKYVKDNFPADYIVVMNNDVLIEDNRFIPSIKSIYEDTGYEVLGPDIVSANGVNHQNPLRAKGFSKSEVEEFIEIRKKWLCNGAIKHKIMYLKTIIKKLIGGKFEDDIAEYALKERLINPVLHGACLVFAKEFIKNEEFAFNPDTFMYLEEDILHYTCQKKGYIMVYDSSIVVKHLEQVSTKLLGGAKYKKAKAKEEQHLKSATVLLNLMND